jgi:predicted membrane channel-forming protein YqfA (hemolysin III family)
MLIPPFPNVILSSYVLESWSSPLMWPTLIRHCEFPYEMTPQLWAIVNEVLIYCLGCETYLSLMLFE